MRWRDYAWAYALGTIVLLAAGCLWQTTPPPAPATLPEQADDLRGTGDRIRRKADQIQEKTGDGRKVAAAPQWDQIDDAADDIKAETETLKDQASGVEAAQAQIQALQARIADLEKQLDAATAGTRELESKMWLVFMGIGALLILAAAPIAYMGNIPLAAIVGFCGLAAVGIGKFMEQWAWLVGLGVAVALLAIIGYLAWAAYKNRNHLLEVVRSAEVMKKYVPEWGDDEKGKAIKDAVSTPQSKATQNLVNKMRREDALTDRVRTA